MSKQRHSLAYKSIKGVSTQYSEVSEDREDQTTEDKAEINHHLSLLTQRFKKLLRHPKRELPASKRENVPSQKSEDTWDDDDNIPQCYKCRRFGHISPDCPTKDTQWKRNTYTDTQEEFTPTKSSLAQLKQSFLNVKEKFNKRAKKIEVTQYSENIEVSKLILDIKCCQDEIRKLKAENQKLGDRLDCIKKSSPDVNVSSDKEDAKKKQFEAVAATIAIGGGCLLIKDDKEESKKIESGWRFAAMVDKSLELKSDHTESRPTPLHRVFPSLFPKEEIVRNGGKCVNVRKLFKQHEQLEKSGASQEILDRINKAIDMEFERRFGVDDSEVDSDSDADEPPLESPCNNDTIIPTPDHNNDHSPIEKEENGYDINVVINGVTYTLEDFRICTNELDFLGKDSDSDNEASSEAEAECCTSDWRVRGG
ncbi:uncharacterized protein LOC113279244 [Papaver somniferum]|uniref:uncharacterized protein LOC113279244 n=1 Tax=Papaver somniferum TaxID=3469 RepID=UPI000E6F8460|nr:uncharacterized protein LOC113279244 [Papaver somniferum]